MFPRYSEQQVVNLNQLNSYFPKLEVIMSEFVVFQTALLSCYYFYLLPINLEYLTLWEHKG